MVKPPSPRARTKPAKKERKARAPAFLPSPEATTNLLIADIVLRGASNLFRKSVERKVARASVDDEEEAERLIDGRTALRTLGLYGASRLATRSPAGLGLVAGGLVLKTLYDRGKARQQRTARQQQRARRARPKR
ncbi:MAG: hypothetical protein QNI87_14645 [Erythrobacter sp.]|uniref:hypothetical protein n=1 Tax=Erythrobacter sp. TaxID=1042 RepID=UPI00262BCB56|nr:hypothetical protein [Erythrobacter sp.]MDJ0979760.1 hypothetical protein [Erythrobacter sp.]